MKLKIVSLKHNLKSLHYFGLFPLNTLRLLLSFLNCKSLQQIVLEQLDIKMQNY